MADERQERAPDSPGAAAGEDHHSEIDWIAAERSPEFRELIKKRRSFVLPATIFFLAWYFGFIILAGYAEDFMGEYVYERVTDAGLAVPEEGRPRLRPAGPEGRRNRGGGGAAGSRRSGA
jgi:hypothetical protein